MTGVGHGFAAALIRQYCLTAVRQCRCRRGYDRLRRHCQELQHAYIQLRQRNTRLWHGYDQLRRQYKELQHAYLQLRQRNTRLWHGYLENYVEFLNKKITLKPYRLVASLRRICVQSRTVYGGVSTGYERLRGAVCRLISEDVGLLVKT